jgi:hypothetical protein
MPETGSIWDGTGLRSRVSRVTGDVGMKSAASKHFYCSSPMLCSCPRIIAAIVDGTAPADLTVTGPRQSAAVFVGRAPVIRERLLAIVSYLSLIQEK